MPCNYGSEKKFPTDSTIVVNPYDGVNNAAATFMALAAIPNQIEFDADEICSTEPPDFQEIEIADFANLGSLNDKVYNNARRTAWFKGCQCKVEPPPVQESPQIDFPTNGVYADLAPFTDSCSVDLVTTSYLIQTRGWNENNIAEAQYTSGYFSLVDYPNLELERDGSDSFRVNWWLNGSFYTSEGGSGSGYLIYDWKMEICQGQEEPPTEGILPLFPDLCGDSSNGSCDADVLRQVDKADILSILQLYISESNDRVIAEVKLNTDATLFTVDNNAKAYKQEILNLINSRLDFITGVITGRYDASEANADNREQNLKDWVDGAKGQILAAVTASAGTVLAAIAASTASMIGAITTATAEINSAITALGTELNTLINGVKDILKQKIEDELTKWNPKVAVVTVSVSQIPDNFSITGGNGTAPRRICVGWIWFYVEINGAKAYYPREFINTDKTQYVAPISGENVGYVLHLVAGVIASSSIEYKELKR